MGHVPGLDFSSFFHPLFSVDPSKSMERWKSLRARTRCTSVQKLEIRHGGRHLLPWNWYLFACKSESYQQICEECSPQIPDIQQQRCRHRRTEKPQSGYTNPME